jgi:CDP-glycerol glycerophosphotransferase
VHIENRGLGAARNEGIRHARGEYLGFCDADDLMTPRALGLLLDLARETDAPLVTGNVVRLDGDRRPGLPWMNRLHADRGAIVIDDLPELLGDVFAWNKLFRRDFWESSGISWPERIRYEDQPATTDAYLRAGRIGVTPEVVYHWRVRHDGSSITQQRATVADLTDRWTTKRMALASVEAYGAPAVTDVFRDRVLPGDMGQYFVHVPDCSDEWWDLLVTGVREFWGPQRSLTGSTLPPAQRLIGWLVEQDRRADAALVSSYARGLGGPLPRVRLADGSVRVDVPGLDPETVVPEALRLRDHES